MRIDRTHRPWFAWTALLFAAATLVYIPYAMTSQTGPDGGSAVGLTFGIAGYAMMLFAGLLGKPYAFGFQLGFTFGALFGFALFAGRLDRKARGNLFRIHCRQLRTQLFQLFLFRLGRRFRPVLIRPEFKAGHVV